MHNAHKGAKPNYFRCSSTFVFLTYTATLSLWIDTHPHHCIPVPCKAQNLGCVGREHWGPAGLLASFASFACPFHKWPSCRPTMETSWSRYRSQVYHLQDDKVWLCNILLLWNIFGIPCKKREKETRVQTFLFLLLGNICYNVIHIVWHNVALFPLWTHKHTPTHTRTMVLWHILSLCKDSVVAIFFNVQCTRGKQNIINVLAFCQCMCMCVCMCCLNKQMMKNRLWQNNKAINHAKSQQLPLDATKGLLTFHPCLVCCPSSQGSLYKKWSVKVPFWLKVSTEIM